MIIIVISIISIVLALQGMLTLYWMLYAWEDPKRVDENKSPRVFLPPGYSFTALVPAWQEKEVIADTIRAISSIKYPQELMKLVVICKKGDNETIDKVRQTIDSVGRKNIHLVIFDSEVRSKPHALNMGLTHVDSDIVCVFDAEDEPHPSIYSIVNTIMKKNNSDVVQSGVQLMNLNGPWFSVCNVLEYYFWFKSTIHFFHSKGFIPLGGNTVFMKTDLVRKLGGWDVTCLTEDADMGIRLSTIQAVINVVYDEAHVTQEETPGSTLQFIRQRSRWNQGFMQILIKGNWMKVTGIIPKILAGYVFLWPLIQMILFIYLPISIYFSFKVHLPVLVAMVTALPVYMVILILLTNVAGLYEFHKHYSVKGFWIYMIKLIITFFPYQLVLSLGALRALVNMINQNGSWEKTKHFNVHRNDHNAENIEIKYT